MHTREYNNTEEDFLLLQRWINNEIVNRYWCAGMFSWPLTREAIGAFISGSSSRHAYLAVDDEDTVFGFFILQSDEQHNSELIRLVIIDDTIRGKGYGSALLTLAAEIAFRERGRDFVELDVFTENEKAMKCYERNGFVIQKDVDADVVIDGKNCTRYHMKKVYSGKISS